MKICVKRFTTNYNLRYCKHVQRRNDYGMERAELFVANEQIFAMF